MDFERSPLDGSLARVLVVDDEEQILAFLHQALSAEGFDVITARDGFEALGAVRETPPDVIVLDLMMPSLDGAGFLEIYRDAPTQHAPLIAISASREAMRAVDGVVDSVIHKPIDIDRLLRLIRHHVGVPKLTTREAIGSCTPPERAP